MEDDLHLLCANARSYNQEGSQIYVDSLELESGFLAARAHIESGAIDFGDSDEDPSPEVCEAMHPLRIMYVRCLDCILCSGWWKFFQMHNCTKACS